MVRPRPADPALDDEFAGMARHDPAARRLATIPGIGVLNATALIAGASQMGTSTASVALSLASMNCYKCSCHSRLFPTNGIMSSAKDGGFRKIETPEVAGRKLPFSVGSPMRLRG